MGIVSWLFRNRQSIPTEAEERARRVARRIEAQIATLEEDPDDEHYRLCRQYFQTKVIRHGKYSIDNLAH